MAAALEGVTVVALEQAVAAPLCTARLAEAGARVIKVERREGDFARSYDHVVHGESAYFVWLNGGKESIALDIKAPGDAALLARMIARADVFVQNLAPGAAARAGFGSDALRRRHPRLVTCDISGYGEEGPARAMKAYDLLIQCEAGLAALTGSPAEPGRVGVSIADIGCGMNAYAGILEALYARRTTGEGQRIAVSLFDGVADWMAVPLMHYEYGGAAPGRLGLAHPSLAPYGAFRIGDGGRLVIAVQNEREWRAFCAIVLERDDLAADPRFASSVLRCANRTDVEAEIGFVLAGLTTPDTIARLTMAGIAYARINEVADLACHGQLRRRTTLTQTGSVSLPASPVRASLRIAEAKTVPGLDQHGARLRREFANG